MTARTLPWIDGLAALAAGALVLGLRGDLAGWYGLPPSLVTTIGAVNIIYSAFGLTLGPLRRRPAWLLYALIAANLVWAGICAALVVRHAGTATIWGLGHVAGEGVFVTALALLEWRYRNAILSTRQTGMAASPVR